MPTYHLYFNTIKRSAGPTVTQCCSYISGYTLMDSLKKELCENRRFDVLYAEILLPMGAPERLYQPQLLVDEIERVEKRKDARTAREIIASLPNELSPDEIIRILKKFIKENILIYGLGAFTAIHEGKNEQDPTKNNPHAHIIVPTRPIGPEGFCSKKNRECDRVEYLIQCRESMARIQNEGYERNGFNIRVDHRSFRAQGIEHEPKRRLRYMDYKLEKVGVRTLAGDYNRGVEERNAECDRLQLQEKERSK